jgi:hypothetical protein
MSDRQPATGPADPGRDAGTPVEPIDPVLRALARGVDRTGRRVDALDALVAQLAADLATLARYVRADTAHPTAQPGPGGARGEGGEGDEVSPPRAWLLADDPGQAAADLDDLCTWVARVYLRYPRTELPSCWLWHPHAVEELWWLRKAHADAYHPQTGSWPRVGEWHDRQLPGVTQRLAHAIGSCELALHRPGERAAGAPRPVPFADAAPCVAQTWTGSGGQEPGPEPTRQQLAQADAYFRALHQSGR